VHACVVERTLLLCSRKLEIQVLSVHACVEMWVWLYVHRCAHKVGYVQMCGLVKTGSYEACQERATKATVKADAPFQKRLSSWHGGFASVMAFVARC
jgi:hypothetical protein